jgi:alanine racemase
MRLELKSGINQCQVIDDSYNNDFGGLQISLDFLAHQHQRKNKTLILSDMLQSGQDESTRVQRMAEMVNAANLQKFIGVGPVVHKYNHFFKLPSRFYRSTEEFIQKFNTDDFSNEIILIKGSRVFRLERITALLQQKLHRTVMEVNLGALVNNLNFFKAKLKPNTRVMVMVKAFAYGSGSIEVANLLQYHQVDYLGVAYADEGVDLRKHNIRTRIMVMNPTEESFQALLDYNLEPEVYSMGLMRALLDFLQGRPLRIHLKVDTGMHRLGFEPGELPELIAWLREHKNLHIASVFSHLAGSDEPELDSFSEQQATAFLAFCEGLTNALDIQPIRHLINTSGIVRLPRYHLDMVRLGIGLYGVNPSPLHVPLMPVITLKTVVSQVRTVKAGVTIGYGRKGRIEKETQVATIAIGYADGFSRANSQGKGVVMIQGKRVPVLGNVCMDMTMVDVTGLEVKEGDEVIVFGETLPIQEAASRIGTIPYEVLTSTSSRVKRIFIAEGM